MLPSVLYSTLAPDSAVPTLSVPSLVILSVLLVPVSLDNARLSAAGALVSSVKDRLVALDALPPAST